MYSTCTLPDMHMLLSLARGDRPGNEETYMHTCRYPYTHTHALTHTHTGRSENSSRRSSSLDCLEPQSSVNHHQTDTQKRLHETTESTDSVVLTQRRATGRTHSVAYGREPSKNPSLLTVFKRLVAADVTKFLLYTCSAPLQQN